MDRFAYLDVHKWSCSVHVSMSEECAGNEGQLDNRAWFPGFFTGFGGKMLQGMTSETPKRHRRSVLPGQHLYHDPRSLQRLRESLRYYRTVLFWVNGLSISGKFRAPQLIRLVEKLVA